MHVVQNNPCHDIYVLDNCAVLLEITKGKVVVLDSYKEIC